jgi:hypothetical protein
MMEHAERKCPGCGEPAANYRFCPSCGTNIGLPSEHPTQREWRASDARHEPVQPMTFGRLSAHLSAPESNGASGHSEDETAASAITEVGCDGSAPADVSTEVADAPTEVAAESPETVEIPARAEWKTVDASHRPAHAALPPLTFGRLSAPEANGVGEHRETDTSSHAVTDVSFDHPPAEDAVVEPTTAVLEAVEIPADRDWETSGSSHQPAEEPVPPVAFEPLPAAETNGAYEYNHDETSTAAVIEHIAVDEEPEADATVEHPETSPLEWESGDAGHQPADEPAPTMSFERLSPPEANGAGEHRVDDTFTSAVTADQRAEDDSAPNEVAAPEPAFVSDQPFTEAAQETATRSSTRQPMAFACLALAIGLLVLLMSRGRRRNS